MARVLEDLSMRFVIAALLLSAPALAADPARRVQHELTVTAAAGGPTRLKLPDRVAHTDTARLQVRVGAERAEVPRNQWGFVDSRTIQLLPIGSEAGPQHVYELSYEALPER